MLAIGHAEDPAIEPCFSVFSGLGLFVVVSEECIVTAVVALYWRRMRPVATVDHGIDEKTGNDSAIGIAGDHLGLNNLLGADNDTLRGANALNHDAEIPPAMRVALAISTLHVNDGDIGIQRAHCAQRFLRLERRDD